MSSLLVIAPLPRLGSGNVTALVAVPCQVISECYFSVGPNR